MNTTERDQLLQACYRGQAQANSVRAMAESMGAMHVAALAQLALDKYNEALAEFTAQNESE